MTAAVVQSKEASNAGGGTSLASGDMPSPVTAGNLLFVAAVCNADGSIHNTPTDTLGHTYTQIGSQVVHTVFTPDHALACWYVENCSGGTNEVTANFSASADLRGVFVVEISGLRASGAFDVQSKNAFDGDSGADVVVSGSATNTDAPAILIGIAHDIQGDINAAGTGFTSFATGWNMGGANPKMRAEYKLLSATGSQQATFADNAFNRHLVAMAIFLEAPPPVIIPRADYSKFPKHLLREAAR